jgi:hypothetical protein
VVVVINWAVEVELNDFKMLERHAGTTTTMHVLLAGKENQSMH